MRFLKGPTGWAPIGRWPHERRAKWASSYLPSKTEKILGGGAVRLELDFKIINIVANKM